MIDSDRKRVGYNYIMREEQQITQVKAHHIALSIAKSSVQVSSNMVGVIRARNSAEKSTHLNQIEQELTATQYWFQVMKNDTTKRGWLMRRSIDNTHTALNIGLALLDIAQTRNND